jgi:hypothetical protein
LNSDRAAPAGLIDDDHLLAERRRHFRRDNSRHDIGYRARWKRIDDLNRLVRILGGVRQRDEQR